MADENKPAEVEQVEQKAEAAPKKQRLRTLLDRLYSQLDILEREQGKIVYGYEGSQNPKAARTEYLTFAKQINDIVNTIIDIKRGGKQK